MLCALCSSLGPLCSLEIEAVREERASVSGESEDSKVGAGMGVG